MFVSWRHISYLRPAVNRQPGNRGDTLRAVHAFPRLVFLMRFLFFLHYDYYPRRSGRLPRPTRARRRRQQTTAAVRRRSSSARPHGRVRRLLGRVRGHSAAFGGWAVAPLRRSAARPRLSATWPSFSAARPSSSARDRGQRNQSTKRQTNPPPTVFYALSDGLNLVAWKNL